MIKEKEEIEASLQQIKQKEETYNYYLLHVFGCLNSTKNNNFREWVLCVNIDIGCGQGKEDTQ